MTTTTDTRRSVYIQGLHDLGHLLHDNPNLPLPHDTEVLWFIHGDLGEALALRDAMTDPTTHHDTSANFPVNITGSLAGLKVKVYIAAAVALLDGETNPPHWPACDPRLGLDAAPAVLAATGTVAVSS